MRWQRQLDADQQHPKHRPPRCGSRKIHFNDLFTVRSPIKLPLASGDGDLLKFGCPASSCARLVVIQNGRRVCSFASLKRNAVAAGSDIIVDSFMLARSHWGPPRSRLAGSTKFGSAHGNNRAPRFGSVTRNRCRDRRAEFKASAPPCGFAIAIAALVGPPRHAWARRDARNAASVVRAGRAARCADAGHCWFSGLTTGSMRSPSVRACAEAAVCGDLHPVHHGPEISSSGVRGSQ